MLPALRIRSGLAAARADLDVSRRHAPGPPLHAAAEGPCLRLSVRECELIL